MPIARDVEKLHFISRKKNAHHAVILTLKCEDVILQSINFILIDNWSTKAKRRNAKGTGRMRYEKKVQKYILSSSSSSSLSSY